MMGQRERGGGSRITTRICGDLVEVSRRRQEASSRVGRRSQCPSHRLQSQLRCDGDGGGVNRSMYPLLLSPAS